MLACRFRTTCSEPGQAPWTFWLPEIQYQLNTAVQSAMKTTSYELMFGQPPRTTLFPGASGHVMEKDVEELLLEGDDALPNTLPERGPVRCSQPDALRIASTLPEQSVVKRAHPMSSDEDDITGVLGTSEKHLKRRKLADEQYRLNAKRMGEKYFNKTKVRTFRSWGRSCPQDP